jgi:hypothetical protein
MSVTLYFRIMIRIHLSPTVPTPYDPAISQWLADCERQINSTNIEQRLDAARMNLMVFGTATITI